MEIKYIFLRIAKRTYSFSGNDYIVWDILKATPENPNWRVIEVYSNFEVAKDRFEMLLCRHFVEGQPVVYLDYEGLISDHKEIPSAQADDIDAAFGDVNW